MGADSLGFGSIEDGYISWSHHFEKLINGEWVECPDQRIRLSAGLSDLEAAIDEENRRRFPGDFDTGRFDDDDADRLDARDFDDGYARQYDEP